MVECIMNPWKVDLSNEYGSIGEKVAKKWLQENGYEVYSFQEIIWKITDIRIRKKSKAKYATSEKGREFLRRTEEFLGDIFGERLEDMKKYDKAIRKLAREKAEIRLARDYRRVGIGPDFIVKKDGDIVFVEVKVNQSQPKKHQRTSFKIAKEHGFKTMILRLNVQIHIQKDIQLTEL